MQLKVSKDQQAGFTSVCTLDWPDPARRHETKFPPIRKRIWIMPPLQNKTEVMKT